MKMEITTPKIGELHVKPYDRIDTTTAVEFGSTIYDKLDDLDDITKLILDFSEVKYVSSMGLRILLELQKRMNELGTMVLTNVNEDIVKVFEITGFNKILKVQ